MGWYLNGTINLIKSYIKLEEQVEPILHDHLEKLFRLTLTLSIREKTFPVTAACHMFVLLEKLLKLAAVRNRRQPLELSNAIHFLIGSMMLALKIDGERSYYLRDFVIPIRMTFGPEITLITLKKLELQILTLLKFKMAPINARAMVATTLKYCNEHDIMQFWQELHSPDYHETEDYIKAAKPFVAQVYRNKLCSIITPSYVANTDSAQSDRVIFWSVNNLCDTIKLQKDFSLVLTILNENSFNFLRVKHIKYQTFFFAYSYPTLWENITSLIKEKAAVKTTAHLLESYQRCLKSTL